MSESWPIPQTCVSVRLRMREVLDAYQIKWSPELVAQLSEAAAEMWTVDEVAAYTNQKRTSVPAWIARHGVPRFTGAVYSRTAVENAKAAMPGKSRGNRGRNRDTD